MRKSCIAPNAPPVPSAPRGLRVPRAAAALALLLAAQVFAQTAPGPGDQASDGMPADPFDAADFDVAASAAVPGSALPGGDGAPSGVARTEYLVGGAVLVSASLDVPAAFDGYAASALAAGKLFGKVSVPDYGSLYMSYNVSQGLFAGLSGNGAEALAPPLSLTSASWALGELYYSFDIEKALFVRVGKQLLAWGPSRVWTPVDFVNQQKADYFSAVDLRQGRPGLKILIPWGKANAFVFADFSRLIDFSGVPAVQDPLSATTLALRLDATLGGFEFGATGFAGASSGAGVQAKAGLDFSGNIFGTGVYGEFALAPEYSGYSGSFMGSLGFSRALGDLKRWTISGEGFYNSSGAEYSRADLESDLQSGDLTPLYIGRYYGYAALAAKELFSPDLDATLSALANFSDLSWTLRLAADFSFPKALPLTATLAYSGGGAGKEFTLAGGNDSLSLSARTKIEF